MLQRSRPGAVIGLEALVHVVGELLSVRTAEAFEGHRSPRLGIGRDGRQTRESPGFRHQIPGDALAGMAGEVNRSTTLCTSRERHRDGVGPLR